MKAPVDCEYLGLEDGGTHSCIKVGDKYKMIDPCYIFETEWDASERQQAVADASLFNYGVLVFYAHKPDASDSEKCKYLCPTMKGKHILMTVDRGTLLEVREDQIYGVYAHPKRV